MSASGYFIYCSATFKPPSARSAIFDSFCLHITSLPSVSVHFTFLNVANATSVAFAILVPPIMRAVSCKTKPPNGNGY